MRKQKLLILQNELSAYNVPVFNIIAEEFNLTVGFYLKDKSQQECFFEKKSFSVNCLGSLVFVKGLRAYAKQFDIVCIIPDMHVISYSMLAFLPRKYKVASWSIGYRVSYIHPYDTKRDHILADKVFQSVLSHCDANIFYMEKAKEFWKGTNLNMNKVFVAPNTTAVSSITFTPEEKNEFLFVGTLYKGKGLDVLLSAYKEYVDKTINPYHLKIVGDGNERESLESFVKENGFSHFVMFTGAIYDERKLAEHFKRAILCFSPNQAGLSVPKSMGYGVPFVTRKDAITGGEIYHITNGVNGIMYEKDDDILKIMEDVSKNATKYINMGIAAKEYYDHNATIAHMAKGAMDAFNFVLNK